MDFLFQFFLFDSILIFYWFIVFHRECKDFLEKLFLLRSGNSIVTILLYSLNELSIKQSNWTGPSYSQTPGGWSYWAVRTETITGMAVEQKGIFSSSFFLSFGWYLWNVSISASFSWSALPVWKEKEKKGAIWKTNTSCHRLHKEISSRCIFLRRISCREPIDHGQLFHLKWI